MTEYNEDLRNNISLNTKIMFEQVLKILDDYKISTDEVKKITFYKYFIRCKLENSHQKFNYITIGYDNDESYYIKFYSRFSYNYQYINININNIAEIFKTAGILTKDEMIIKDIIE